MSPEPEVRSASEPIRSVRRRGVVPWETIWPLRSASLLRMYAEMASLSASPLRCAKLLSARYLSLTSLGVPSRPGV